MPEKIEEVTIRENGKIIDTIHITQMTKDKFAQIGEKLYCPNPNCNARIEFASGDKLTYFRTKRINHTVDNKDEQHIKGCPYGVEYDKNGKRKVKSSEELLVNITKKHMADCLELAFKRHIDPDYGKKNHYKIKNGNSEKSKSHKTDDSKEPIKSGKPSISNGVFITDEEKVRQPPIYQRTFDNLEQKDIDKIFAVNGIIDSIECENKYILIRCKTSDNKRAGIYIGEYFKANNEAQYEQIPNYVRYLEKQRLKGKEVFVACLGDVRNDSELFDIYVVIHGYEYIRLDNLGHFDILRNL